MRTGGQILTTEQRSRGGTNANLPAGRDKQSRARRATNALTLLAHIIENSTAYSQDIKAHARKLFRDAHDRLGRINTLDQSIARREAHRIAATINWLHAQTATASTKATAREFHTASKAGSLWMSLDAKLNQPAKGQRDGRERKKMPIPRRAEPESGADDGGQADA